MLLRNLEDPKGKALDKLDTTEMQDLMPEIPWWVKNPDYERVDWLNKFIHDMWPFIDKASHGTIRSIAEPIFADYIGMCKIESIEFEKISLGTLSPTIHGLKVYETNESELVMEPAIKWAGNPDILVTVKLASLRILIQLVDIQIEAAPRITLKPLYFLAEKEGRVLAIPKHNLKKELKYLMRGLGIFALALLVIVLSLGFCRTCTRNFVCLIICQPDSYSYTKAVRFIISQSGNGPSDGQRTKPMEFGEDTVARGR
nr:synaptotagmin-3-like [Coffea arabica]